MDADYFQMLFAYNGWATQRVLEAASQAPMPEYFAGAPGLSYGSLHATLVHILVSEIVWLGRWQALPPPEALSNSRESVRVGQSELPTFEALRSLWREHDGRLGAYVGALTDAETKRSITFRNSAGGESTQPVGQQMAHVVNHGTQFRAEAAVRLSALGYSPGDLDLIVYLRDRA